MDTASQHLWLRVTTPADDRRCQRAALRSEQPREPITHPLARNVRRTQAVLEALRLLSDAMDDNVIRLIAHYAQSPFLLLWRMRPLASQGSDAAMSHCYDPESADRQDHWSMYNLIPTHKFTAPEPTAHSTACHVGDNVMCIATTKDAHTTLLMGDVHTPIGMQGDGVGDGDALQTLFRPLPLPSLFGHYIYALSMMHDRLYLMGESRDAESLRWSVSVHCLDMRLKCFVSIAQPPEWMGSTTTRVLMGTRVQCLVMHDRLYVFGNHSADDILCYDPVKDVWTVHELGLQWPMSRSAVVVYRDRILLCGGENSRRCQAARPGTGDSRPELWTWDAFACMTYRRADATAVVVDGELFTVGGTTQSGRHRQSIEKYLPLSQQWLIAHIVSQAPGQTVPVVF